MRADGLSKILALLPLLVLFCSPLRDNPYDPGSPLYQSFGACLGRTLTKVGNPVDSVKLTFSPADRFCYSNQSGFFEIDSLPLDSCLVTAEREGFEPAHREIVIATRSTDTVAFYLNAHPFFVSFAVKTIHLQAKPDSFAVEGTARVIDPDGMGDIAYVFMKGGVRPETLDYRPITDDFDIVIADDSIAGGDLETLIGKDLTLTAEDNSHDTVSVVTRLVRVVYAVAEPVRPADGDSTTASPTLVWHALTQPYAFTYLVDVFKYGNLIWRQKNPTPSDTTATIGTVLTPGAYTWLVRVVDQFGNESRCRQYGFYVR